MKNITKNPVYCLCHSYIDREDESYAEEWKWWNLLINKGYVVETPILTFHPTHQILLRKRAEYRKKCSAIYAETDPTILTVLGDEHLPIPDYVALDLAKLEHFLHHDTKPICPQCHNTELDNSHADTYYCCFCYWSGLLGVSGDEDSWYGYNDAQLKRISLNQKVEWTFDSGLVLLISHLAYRDYICGSPKANYVAWKDGLIIDEVWESYWTSDGCRREYTWAQKHHVKCLQLEPFLEGKEVEL